MLKKLMKLLIVLCLVHCVFSTGCTSSSCGPVGICTGSFCDCQSNYSPDNTLTTCSATSSCSPIDYSDATNAVISGVYNSAINSSFTTGTWVLGFAFSQAASSTRNIQVLSSSGSSCDEMLVDIGAASTSSDVYWAQSVVPNSDATLCQDSIVASIPWSKVSACMQSSSNTNLYQGTIVTITTLHNTIYNQTNFGKRDQTTTFTTERFVSFNFEANITTDSSATQFQLLYGTNLNILLDTTAPNNASCLLDSFSTLFNVPRSVFVTVTDTNSSESGPQQYQLLVLDNSANSSSAVAAAITNYLNNVQSVSCDNVTTLIGNYSQAFTEVQYRVTSSLFNSSDLSLTLQLDLQVTYPLMANSGTASLSGTSLPPNTITFSDPTCDQFGTKICDQQITIKFDLSAQSCSDFSESATLVLDPACYSGADASLCEVFSEAVSGKKINVPVSFSADWCPTQQRTDLSANFFEIFAGGNQIANGGTITGTRTINSKISVNVVSRVTGSVLQSGVITQLVLSDGVNSYLVPSNQFTQNSTDQGSTLETDFTHTIDPAITPLNFQNQLFYSSTIDYVFEVPTSKRQLGRDNGNTGGDVTSITIGAISTTFGISTATAPSSPSGSPSSTGTKKSSGSAVAIAVGVSCGCVALVVAAIVAVVVIRKRRGNKIALKEDVETPRDL